MTSLPTLWRRRDWVILWLHSASFLMSLLSFLALRATGLLYDLPLTCLPLIPLSFFLLACPFAFFIARKKRYAPSQIIAALPHQFETRFAAESTPADEPLILRTPHHEVAP
jgi:hypothetical protein